ncbi:hypothetical protein QC334_00615 [Streptomyces sp. DH18]|uniref:hypothetical protein n=1 Tax=Streptomyces sp. DH18 TaxID=3040126 RepID=UPI00244342F8|nr:hypothetical protein [Streptomyces sp. DH18]MDG9681250.1 hypothetical protein [Streptomyces sp. DH18]
MVETVNTSSSEGPAPELSGIDLARLALHHARQAAKARGESGARRTKALSTDSTGFITRCRRSPRCPEKGYLLRNFP